MRGEIAVSEKEKAKGKNGAVAEGVTRRGFLGGGGTVVLLTAAYHVVSVFGGGVTAAHAADCSASCTSACVTNCTGCTTVNCTSSTAPDPPPPTCVQGFSK